MPVIAIVAVDRFSQILHFSPAKIGHNPPLLRDRGSNLAPFAGGKTSRKGKAHFLYGSLSMYVSLQIFHSDGFEIA